jgi:diguanylate cyclase (GGDEF)-like protein/PAS domain S-box-containing protein
MPLAAEPASSRLVLIVPDLKEFCSAPIGRVMNPISPTTQDGMAPPPDTEAEAQSPAIPASDLHGSILRALYELSPNGVLVVSAEGTILSNNRKFLEVWQLPEPPGSNGVLTGSDASILQAVLDQVTDPQAFLQRVRELYAEPQAEDHSEVELKDGRTLERHSSVVRGAEGSYLGRVWFFRDITYRKQIEQELRRSEAKFRAVTEAALDAVIVIDVLGKVRYWNAAAQRILGYTAQEASGKDIHQWLAPPRFREAAAKAWSDVAASQERCLSRVREVQAVRKDGSEIPIELSVAPMQLGNDWCAVGILRDVSSRKHNEQRIAWLAHNDVLTELPNRSVFVEDVREALLHRSRTGRPFAVLYVDLDHFKDVNDTLGHSAGDALLQGVAERLRMALRASDRVARFGGDEFAILTTELRDKGDASVLAAKLLTVLSQPFFINGYEVHSSATIGIANSDETEADAGVLLAHADVALYRGKTEGRGTFRFFTSAMDEEVRQRVALLRELREAIGKQELFLLYQPQVNMETGETVGLEALVRWRQQGSRIMPASRFIAAAESGGLIIALGQFVLSQACRQVRSWLDAGLKVPLVAVNVSPAQFKASSEFGAEIARILHQTGIAAEMLEIELTESALMQTSRDNVDTLRHVRQQGVRIAIDDFGTGYSCLDYLRRFPASRIKIAQTFVADLTHDAGSAAIIRAAVGLGRELGLGVIAEGVETAEQAALLRQWGCREAQGFYFARPLTPEEVPDFLRRPEFPPERQPHVMLQRSFSTPLGVV